MDIKTLATEALAALELQPQDGVFTQSQAAQRRDVKRKLRQFLAADVQDVDDLKFALATATGIIRRANLPDTAELDAFYGLRVVREMEGN